VSEVSARLLLNIVHGHLSRDLRHARDCTDRCVDGCGLLGFDEWLEGPVTKSDRLVDERKAERLQSLMRGEIPA
jgi:hypothetical protein